MLRRLLGEGWEVLEEGMNGRTTVFDNPMSQGRNGSAYLLTCLETHKPLDLVILMLGTNDLRFTDAWGAAEGAGTGAYLPAWQGRNDLRFTDACGPSPDVRGCWARAGRCWRRA